MIYGPDGKPFTKQLHFATRDRAGLDVSFDFLPDPDVILAKRGLEIKALKDMLSDDHLYSVWESRVSALSGSDYNVYAGGDSAQDKKAFDFISEIISREDFDLIGKSEEMMESVAYGFKPFEYVWVKDGAYWNIADFIGKPPEWFSFDKESRMVFKKGFNIEELPQNRFTKIAHKASFENPFGVKTFSKCYWAVLFKTKGMDWWTLYVEKYASLFLLGRYPDNASVTYQNDLLDALEQIIGNGVLVVNESTRVEILESKNRKESSDVYTAYIQAAERSISKAVLGETLTTDTSGGTGTFAAAKVHLDTKEQRAMRDRRLISNAWNSFFKRLTLCNFGEDVKPAVFEYVKSENINKEKAERDKILHETGVRFSKTYFTGNYGLSDEDFELNEEEKLPQAFQKEDVRSLYAKTEAEESAEDDVIPDFMGDERFSGLCEKKSRTAIKSFAAMLTKSIASSKDENEAEKKLQNAYESAEKNRKELAQALANVRFVSGAYGEKNGGRHDH